VKILPESFAIDPERLARFQREAEVLASLNHPNIAAIHGFEEGDGIRALVLEFIDGPTLADRIAQGPIPLDETLPIARQVADALEAAHERGIIHRDLKPANIKLRPDGAVKVLDFGLAKAFVDPAAGLDGPAYLLSQSPTMTSPAMTRLGVILGTAAYMSPEQARGRTVDKRSDIWAFGCVLYEMLTGIQTFRGDDTTEVLASVVRSEPDWSSLPADTPPNIRALLLRCLQKDVRKRIRDAGDIVLDLDEPSPAAAPASAVAGTSASILSRRSLLVGLAGLMLGGVITGLGVRLLEPPRTTPVTRFMMRLPPGQRLAGLDLTAMAFSPDGRRLAYVASAGGSQQLYLREMDSLEGMPIAGTEGAASPFFSPDGQWVGFFTLNGLKKVPLSGGAPVVLDRLVDFGRGGSWGVDGNIVFSPGFVSGLSLVPATGGTPSRTLTMLDRQKAEGSHRFPPHLPDGRGVLFTVGTGGSWDNARIEVLRLDTGERKVVIEGGSDGRYLPSGHLVYLRAGVLMAVAFDLDRLAVIGPPVGVVEGVLPSTDNTGAAQAAFAEDGSLFYVPGTGRASERRLVWVDRTGTEQALQLPPRPYRHPRLSPDGQRLALDIDEGNGSDVWLYDLFRGTLTRLTFDGGMSPAWTPDGTKVTFESESATAGAANLFWKSADGSGADERLTTGDTDQFLSSWSTDEKTLAFVQAAPATGWDIWTLSLENGRKPQAFLQTPFNESDPAFSPDGRWVAYESDESGRVEVYVQPFPGPGSKELVSTDGGTDPAWSRDGRELFYRSGDRMMAVATAIRPTFRASKPEVLFERPYWAAFLLRNYDVSPDGRRFLMIKESEQAAAAVHINVVQHWLEELKRLVPGN
jgi:serine/threonine-protein kinase